jgi:hypothetical protein
MPGFLDVGSGASIHTAARYLCAAANATNSEEMPSVTVRFALESSDRKSEDDCKLLIDRALAHVFPQIDVRRLTITSNEQKPILQVTVDSGLELFAGPRRAVDGVGYAVDPEGRVAPVDSTAVSQARKDFFRSLKPAIRDARLIVTELFLRNTARKGRKSFFAGSGIAFVAAIVAVDPLYAYLAVESAEQHGKMFVVGKVPRPDETTLRSKQFTITACPAYVANPEAYALKPEKGARPVFAAQDWRTFAFVAHRASYREAGVPTAPVTSSLELGDIVFETLQADELNPPLSSDAELTEAVIAGVSEARQAIAERPDLSKRVESMRNLGEEQNRRPPGAMRALKKARDDLCVMTSAVIGDEVPWREGPQIEFKAKINIFDPSDKGGQTNTERVRQILAGMANARGGALLVGVTDDGKVQGAPRIADEVRTTQFAPSMNADAIAVREVPLSVPGAASTLSGQWWKAAPSAVPAGGAKPATADNVITIFRVMASSVPFHSTGATADSAPMVRGAASTVSLSVWGMVERLVAAEMAAPHGKRPRDGEV